MCKIEKCVAGVAEFNVIAGNYQNIGYDTLLAQAKVVREEGIELYNAVHDVEGKEQILKEAVDVLVTAFGFVGILQNLGYDVYGAWKEVNKNNLDKFPKSQTDAFYTKTGYEASGVTTEVVQYNHNTWVIKDTHGKVRKPIGYQKVCLKKYLPQEET